MQGRARRACPPATSAPGCVVLARATAAKEATGKAMARAPSTKPDEATPLAMVPDESAASLDPTLGGLRAAARLKAHHEARQAN
jgi:hypothetical protein